MVSRQLVYFHGVPGAPVETEWLNSELQDQGLTVVCVNRFALPASLTGKVYYQQIAQEVLALTQGRSFDVVGFSLGAFVALQTLPYLQGQVKSLHLVSAAAPLEAGNFLPNMAGRLVFKWARSAPLLFQALSRWQGVLAALAPRMLFRMLFASAVGADKALATEARFQAPILQALQWSFGRGLPGYLRDVQAYVQPWADALKAVKVSTTIWHGDKDNWAPVAMAHSLAAAIPGCVPVEIMDGQSHYSCLFQVLEKIGRLPGQSLTSTP